MRAHAVVTALLLLTRVIPASAQELSAETLQAINAASRARVRLADEGWHRLAGTGRGMSADGGRLYVRDGNADSSLTEVALGDVRELQVARGSNAGKGAFIGGAIGLGLSIVAVIALVRRRLDHPQRRAGSRRDAGQHRRGRRHRRPGGKCLDPLADRVRGRRALNGAPASVPPCYWFAQLTLGFHIANMPDGFGRQAQMWRADTPSWGRGAKGTPRSVGGSAERLSGTT